MKLNECTMLTLSSAYHTLLRYENEGIVYSPADIILLGNEVMRKFIGGRWYKRSDRPAWAEQLGRALDDGRINDLSRSQKRCLLWFSACALSGYAQEQEWALDILRETLDAAHTVWMPVVWPFWMGPMPDLGKSRMIGLMPEHAPDPVDPSGDPEPDPLPPLQLERSSAWSWSSVGQVLDGVTLWPAIIQEYTGLPCGDMQLLGWPDWKRLAGYQLDLITETFRRAA